jgi:hypothetical protein
MPLTGRLCLGDSPESIMIGKGYRSKPGRKGAPDHGFGSKPAIRGSRMDVEIYCAAELRRAGYLSQRRYPISGAVQEGCE